MSTPGELIPRSSLAWLLVAQLTVILPHLPRLPLWAGAFWLLCVLWRIQIQRMRWTFPSLLIRALGLLLVFGMVFSHLRTLIGLDATVMLLVLLFMLKLLEMRTPRDALVVIYLGFFVTATAFLFDQGILLTLYQVGVLLVLVAALVGLQQTAGRQNPLSALRVGGMLLLQAVPLMLVLFLLFPRIAPLWAVNAPGSARMTGLAESMAPADVAELARSGALAFRVSFDGDIPPASELYWRSMTLADFDGRRWSMGAPLLSRVSWEPRGPQFDYQVVAGASGQPWLFALRGASSNDPGVLQTADFNLRARAALNAITSYQVQSRPQSLLQPEGLNAAERARFLALPEGVDPRSRAWAAELRTRHAGDADLIDSLMQHFNREPYHYTLRPQRLGQHSNDEFLFDTQRGFCAHYAGAMTFVLRAAGIPARVVAGYQGGELNPRGNHLLIHQFDAHAWVEAWLPEQGWVTYDPTFAVAPERIERGLQDAVRGEGSFLEDAFLSPVRYREVGWINQSRLFWDDVNYQWQLRVLGYQSEQQLRFLQNWFGTTDWQRIAVWALLLVLLATVPVVLWILRPARRAADWRVRAWQRLDRRLARIGLQAQPGEGPRSWELRLMQHLPGQRAELKAFFEQFVQVTYAEPEAGSRRSGRKALQQSLRVLLRRLPRRRPPQPTRVLDEVLSSGSQPPL
ncbi:MAG: DUF3488 and DUF4129 domain-containing transglutaminase family protein [Halopseudomonas yangmingensis]